jgi:hypothetical protein
MIAKSKLEALVGMKSSKAGARTRETDDDGLGGISSSFFSSDARFSVPPSDYIDDAFDRLRDTKSREETFYEKASSAYHKAAHAVSKVYRDTLDTIKKEEEEEKRFNSVDADSDSDSDSDSDDDNNSSAQNEGSGESLDSADVALGSDSEFQNPPTQTKSKGEASRRSQTRMGRGKR